jgi:hypothetical protein
MAFSVAILVACLGLVGAAFAAGDSQPPADSKSIEIKGKGITIKHPQDWIEVPSQFVNAHELYRVPMGPAPRTPSAQTPRILVTTEDARDHEQAIRRLGDIASEASSVPHTFRSIGGWPALQRRQVLPVERPDSQPAPATRETYVRITTAIAAGSIIVRLEGFVPSGAGRTVPDELLEIGAGLAFATQGDPARVQREIEELRTQHQPRSQSTISATASVTLASAGSVVSSAHAEPELNVRVNNSTSHDSEIEVAVSTNGQNIVVGNNARDWSFSNDGGKTWNFGGTLAVPGGFFAANGDPSLAFGRSGAFYYAFIGYPDTDASGARDECSTVIDRSTNGGQTFGFRGNAVYCNDGGGPVCFPDQEHIAADRFNIAAGGGDQVYSVWRHFTGGTCLNSAAGPTASIVCSNDGGQTWSGVATIDGGGDRPRIAVGADGSVHVVYRAGGDIMYRRYSSCTSGLVPAGPPVPVALGIPGDASTCPLPGIDRCSSPFLSSQTVAVDDTNPSHIYVAYAFTTAAGVNEEIFVQDSTDGGLSFPPVRIAALSTGVVARRYMPWACAVGGAAYVGWYDRRNATGADNSLTDYFVGSASLDALGNLAPGTEFKISRASDSACASGWITDGTGGNQNCVPRDTPDSESCTAQPQLAGRCCQVALSGNNCPAGMGSGTPCDFSDGGCPGGEACQTGNGCPKYGDYSGITCGAGRFYAAWASATSPASITPASGNIDVFVDQKLVCCVPQIQVPGDLALSDACVGDSSTTTLQVCNTGKEDLEIDSITSSSTKFSVTAPSSGYPVVISPDFCFPFQVKFTPTGTGSVSGTLTITSNDPVNPTVTVNVSGSGIEKDVRVTGSTDFGDVCGGVLAEKTLSVCNVGPCDLHVTSVAFEPPCADFTLINNPFPATVSPDSCESVVIRFTPTSDGPKTCTLVIRTDDPDTPVISKTVTGNTPEPSIDVPPDLGFPPTVIQSVGACTTPEPFPVSNTGTCPLRITNFAVTTDAAEYSLQALPSFPIILEAGHEAGEGDLSVVFAPLSLDRDLSGAVTVTYESDAVTHALTNVVRALCGEGVRTGARVLATAGGVPLEFVEQIKLSRINANRNKNILDTVDNARNLTLQVVAPAAPCAGFQYHREYGTVSNPIQLLPGSYNVTVTAVVNGHRMKRTVGFDVTTCGFNPTIVVNF